MQQHVTGLVDIDNWKLEHYAKKTIYQQIARYIKYITEKLDFG